MSMGMETPAGAIVCRRCGWRNDASAQMCGGCGQPLPFVPAASLGTRYGGTSTLPGTPAPQYASPTDDTPTVVAYGRLVPPPDVPRHPAYQPGAAPAWPAAPLQSRSASTPPRSTARAAPARRGNCLVRALVTLLVFALMLGCLGVGLWTLVIRPPLHAQVDGGIRAALGVVVDEANTVLGQLPPGLGATAQVPASLINDQLQRHLPLGQPFHNISADFVGGGVVVYYTVAGQSGELYSGLTAQGGRVVARNATVTGPLKLVESSSELQQAVADELAGLTTSVSITRVTAADHMLTVTARAGGG